MEDDFKPVIQPQRHLNPKVQDVVKNKIVKLLDSCLIYPISDSSWVSPIHVVQKKGGMTVVLNDNNELIPSRTVIGWRVCIYYRNLNDATRKDHFPFPLPIRCLTSSKDKRGAENLVADHLSRLENPDLRTFTEEEIAEEFPDEHLMVLKTKLNNDEPWGHHSALVTGRNVYESRFFCSTIFRDAKYYMIRCDACQRSGNISSRREMPQNNIQGAYENTRIYKERTKKWHDSRIRGDKDFKVGDLVLLFNSRFKMHPDKLKSRWDGYCKYYKKRAKTGQEQTRERIECKRAGKALTPSDTQMSTLAIPCILIGRINVAVNKGLRSIG
ncbi:hypothetical protein Tco_0656521 [Tanacetum coccineum]|uniref:Reverse transcriptase domain-containing protein n=1 Tax=Tanacetum coccineum TaxID=301880 RepID=A0ABQ4XA98_9ASTR